MRKLAEQKPPGHWSGAGADRPPDAQTRAPGNAVEVLVCGEQFQAVVNAKLGEQGIDGAELQAGSATGVAQASRLDVIAPVGNDQR